MLSDDCIAVDIAAPLFDGPGAGCEMVMGKRDACSLPEDWMIIGALLIAFAKARQEVDCCGNIQRPFGRTVVVNKVLVKMLTGILEMVI